jgi:hypothetical protein
MIGQDGNEEDYDELFLDVDTDSDDGIPKPEVDTQSVNANGEDFILTPTPDLLFT